MKAVLDGFDGFLVQRALKFSGIIIGGAALIVMDVVDRKTKDVDCLDPEIPTDILEAAIAFAKSRPDLGLWDRWLNGDAKSIKSELPPGWRNRLEQVYEGKALILETLGRSDFLKTKLYAYCDRTEPDRIDLLSLKPSALELDDAISWVKARDVSSKWPDHVETAFKILRKELGYGE